MAFPKLLQKLFQNSGAGDKLNPEIIPDTAAGKYLPLSGGDMTGSIYMHKSATDSTLTVAFNNNTSSTDGGLDLFVGNSSYHESGAGLGLKLRDATNEPGYFYLKAQDNSDASRLEGRPNGDLYWRGVRVLDSGLTVHATRLALTNGVNQNLDFFANDSLGGGFYIPGDHHTANEWVALKTAKDTNSGNITAAWSSGNNWYRKYSDGFIMQGGYNGVSTYGETCSYTFNTPFVWSTACVYIQSIDGGETQVRINGGSVSTTGFTAYRHYCGSSGWSGAIFWLAFGY